MQTQIKTVKLALPRPSGIPLLAEITAEVTQPRGGSFRPSDGGDAPESGEVNYRRLSWKMGRVPQEGDVDDLLADWKGDNADHEAALVELDNLVLEATR